MQASVSPMQLLVSIVERGKGMEVSKIYKTFHVTQHLQSAGRGTAASHLLDTLGFGTAERDIVLSIAPKDTIRQLMYYLKNEDRSELEAKGIAFTMDVSGLGTILAVTLSRIEAMDAERGEMIMEQDIITLWKRIDKIQEEHSIQMMYIQ